jgi:hypothetical protein
MDKRVATLGVLLLIVPCWAKTVTVDDNGPADYRSIQDAINKSWHGDTIVVKPGTYREKTSFNGLRVTVRSENPDDPAVVQATIITWDTDASVAFDFGESKESVLTGFTITGRGIVCTAASPTIAGNVIRNCRGVGINGQKNAAPVITGNQILSNEQEGIYSCDGPIQGNTIEGNSAGIGFCGGPVLDNVISGNGPAGGLYSCGGEIAGNSIAGNRAAMHGGGLRGCTGPIHNNVIAGNQAGGAGGGLYDCKQAIYDNTIVGNRAVQAGGAMSNCPGAVYNNIIAFNEAPTAGGILGPAGNTYNDFWMNLGGNFGGGLISGVGDIVTNPLFVSDGYWSDNGTKKTDDDFWVSGDYHLRSQVGRWDPENRRWVTDGETSHCIDAGKPSSDWTAELWPHGKRINLGAFGGTPEASLSPANLGNPADLDHDEHVGLQDLALISQRWLLLQDLQAEDLDRNGAVDFNDFAIFAMHWRAGPAAPAPPIPNPMTWATKPYATSPYSVAMVATTATSTDGTGVEYYFEDAFYPQYNSGWLYFAPNQEPRWEDTHVQPETLCWYQVKARNRGNRLETAWSERWDATTPREDLAAPMPNPMTWQTQPYGVSGTSIRMEATRATDDSGVEYQFECTSHPTYSSGWQDSPIYEVTSVPRGQYKFQVRARDKSANHNATEPSDEVTVDLQAPTPNPMKWESEPKELYKGGGSFDYWATMTAVEATDDTAGVEYLFECTSLSQLSSGWQTSREYTVKVGRTGQRLRFRVKARDTSPSHNETGWSPELPTL